MSEPMMLDGKVCPYCHRNLDMVGNVHPDSTPKPGQISICMFCGEISRIDENFNFIKISEEEYVNILKQCPEIDDIQKQIMIMKDLLKKMGIPIEG